ncbi:hypothetical protein C8Q78DRAFT_1083794 [Trametes maxima]|nr:hypothetical protein C8Q78DRAFT_1083794 [Trametes maxima]
MFVNPKTFALTVSLVASSFAADPLVINTPANQRWSLGKAAYPLINYVISGGHLIGLFLNINATSFLWPTNVTAGTTVALQVVDSHVAVAQTAPFVIQPGSVGC